jgi:hypothetical protein
MIREIVERVEKSTKLVRNLEKHYVEEPNTLLQ